MKLYISILASVAMLAGCDVQRAHIAANQPPTEQFERLLDRDLKAYFAGHGYPGAVVRYEPLRRGATQSGVALPKYYLWVEVTSPEAATSGAVRVAAIHRERFEITHFVSRAEIAADPAMLDAIFPAPLVANIRQRAQ
jgi:hypothetical protein